MIKTENLTLRNFKKEDLEHMQRYAIRENYYRYLPLDKLTPKLVEDFLNLMLSEQDQEERLYYCFAIEPNKLGHIVGAIHIKIEDEKNRSGSIGYALDSDYRGQGIMTEAVQAVLAFGFKTLSLHRICAVVDTENESSLRVVERAGFKHEGLMRSDTLVRGDWRDSYLYAILQPDWSFANNE